MFMISKLLLSTICTDNHFIGKNGKINLNGHLLLIMNKLKLASCRQIKSNLGMTKSLVQKNLTISTKCLTSTMLSKITIVLLAGF